MRLSRLLTLAATAGTLVAVGTATPALAAKPRYTHSTTLSQPSCVVHANLPKAGVPDWGWTKDSKGGKAHLGVRYTYSGYALVLDYSRSTEPSWGFVAQSCLTNPYAYAGSSRLPDLRAVGGNGAVKDVPTSAPHAGKTRRTTLHVGAGQVGTLRSGGKSFVIGNVQAGDPFTITTAHCGTHNPQAWILGYAPNSGRWGYVQAAHLPACV